MYMYPLPFGLPSSSDHHSVVFPVLQSMFLFVTYFIHSINSVYLSVSLWFLLSVICTGCYTQYLVFFACFLIIDYVLTLMLKNICRYLVAQKNITFLQKGYFFTSSKYNGARLPPDHINPNSRLEALCTCRRQTKNGSPSENCSFSFTLLCVHTSVMPG